MKETFSESSDRGALDPRSGGVAARKSCDVSMSPSESAVARWR